MVDSCSSYSFAKSLRSKTANEVCMPLMEVFWSNSYIPEVLSGDLGKEFNNKEVQMALSQHGVTFRPIRPEYKDVNGSETTNFRINNLMRKLLEGSNNWVPNLQKVIFSLNNSLMQYGKYTYTPAQVFSLRKCANELPCDEYEEFSISDCIQKINEKRLKDHLSLGKVISKKIEYTKGELVLVLREHITAIKTVVKSRILKLVTYWEVVKIEDKVEEDCYTVILKNGTIRKSAKRMIKKIKQEQYDVLWEHYYGKKVEGT